MDEQKLKDIEAPKKEGGVTLKQKRINTYIFTAVSKILLNSSLPTSYS